MIEYIGWLGGLLFAFCGAPQAFKSYKEGNSDGISYIFLWMWGLGEILMQVYVIIQHGLDLPLLVNYWINTIFVLIIGYFKYKPRQN